MGAILAGTIQAPITAILMIFEMTRDYEIIVPLMSACAASALVSSLLQEGSIFTEPMRRRGIRLPRAFTPTWMRQPKVWTVLEPDVAAISPVERFQNVVDHLLMAPEGHDQVYVTSQEGTYLGSISLHEIKRYFRETQHLDSVIAADIVNPSAPFVYADDPLSRAIELLSTTSAEYLPVLTDPVARRLVGTVSKRSLLAAYSAASLPHQNGTDPPLP
jgi:CIC family chloride channel protein